MKFTKYNIDGEIIFQDLFQNSELLEKLGQPGHYTLFAPTNEAFEQLGIDVLERIQSDKQALKGKSDFFKGLFLVLS